MGSMAMMRQIVILGIFACYILPSSLGQNLDTVVNLPGLGNVKGILGVTSEEQTPYYTFHGIREYIIALFKTLAP
jgi:hypothetical protein